MAKAVVARAAAGRAAAAVKDRAEVVAIPAAEVARVPAAAVQAGAAVVAGAEALAAAVLLAAVVVVEAVEVPVAAAGPVVVVGPGVVAAPEALAAEGAEARAVVAVAARVRVEARAEDRAAATAGVLVAEAIGKFERLAGAEGARRRLSRLAPSRPALIIGRDPLARILPQAGTPCKLAVIPSQLEALVSTPRGRQARLRTEYAGLYPGLKPGVWMPVEKLLRHVTELIHADRSKSGVITGRRLLHDHHFEYRGASGRPEGLPEGHTRLSDSSAEPSQRTGTSGPSGREPAKARKRHG